MSNETKLSPSPEPLTARFEDNGITCRITLDPAIPEERWWTAAFHGTVGRKKLANCSFKRLLNAGRQFWTLNNRESSNFAVWILNTSEGLEAKADKMKETGLKA